jgi:hypothetical protein
MVEKEALCGESNGRSASSADFADWLAFRNAFPSAVGGFDLARAARGGVGDHGTYPLGALALCVDGVADGDCGNVVAGWIDSGKDENAEGFRCLSRRNLEATCDEFFAPKTAFSTCTFLVVAPSFGSLTADIGGI